MKKRCSAVLLTLVLCLTLFPTTALADDSDFIIVDGVLNEYIGPGGEVTIPDGVTSIERGAFSGCRSLTSVKIPEGVASIEEYTFENCVSLTSVTIPDSVTSIGYSAFKGCTSLKSVTIPKSLVSIGSYAFWGCKDLANVTIPDSVDKIGAWAFRGSLWQKSLGEFAVVNGILIEYQGQGGTATIPDGVTSIASQAFDSCINLASVTIPESVTSIGSWAFNGCKRLSSVNIPKSVKSIEQSTFSDCKSLTSVVIPDSVTTIGNWAFSGCVSLTRATIPDSVTNIGAVAFVGCPDLTVYGRPGSYAEQYCRDNNIPFASTILNQGTLTGEGGRELAWDVSMMGEVTVAGDMAQGEAVLVGCYDSQGRFTGVKVMDAQHATAQIDPNTPNVRLFWLNAANQPQSDSATVWGK